MAQAILKPVTFDEFIDWYPENSESCFLAREDTWFRVLGFKIVGQWR